MKMTMLNSGLKGLIGLRGRRPISLRPVWLDEIRSWRVPTSVKLNPHVLSARFRPRYSSRRPALLCAELAAMAEAITPYSEHVHSEYICLIWYNKPRNERHCSSNDVLLLTAHQAGLGLGFWLEQDWDWVRAVGVNMAAAGLTTQ